MPLTPVTESSVQESLFHEFQRSSKPAASFSFPHEFCLMYVAGIGLSWHLFGAVLETNLLASAGSGKTHLLDSPGSKKALSRCLLSQVGWGARFSVLPTKLDLLVRDRSDAGPQSWNSQAIPVFDQKIGQPVSDPFSSSWLPENDSSCKASTACFA